MVHFSDMQASPTKSDLKAQILARVASRPDAVWTPIDFLSLAGRAAVDKALQRLAIAGDLRRIDRGLYDRPRLNALTGRPTVPDYRAVVDAIARRDQVRVVVDGMTAANDLGLTTAVPARIEVLVDARLRPVRLGNQEIHFKEAAPSRLYWADRPAMRIVQALYWLHDVLRNDAERSRIMERLRRLLAEPPHGQVMRDDLRSGLPTLPIWMQEIVRSLLEGEDKP